MTEKQKEFHERNKYRSQIGRCVICGSKTQWNETKDRYERYCSDACIKRFVDIRNKRMIDKYGTSNLASIPEFQRDKLMANRSIAKEYVFKDGSVKKVLSNLEYKVLKEIEDAGYNGEDVFAPAQFVVTYTYMGQTKNHFPDIYIKSLNLIVSVKDGMDNPNMHPSFQKDRAKNIAIYKSILDNYKYNYIQVEGEKDIKAVKGFLSTVKRVKGGTRFIIPPRIDFILYNESESVSIVNEKDRINYIIMERNKVDLSYSNFYLCNDVIDNFYTTVFLDNDSQGLIAIPRSKVINTEDMIYDVIYVAGIDLHMYDFIPRIENPYDIIEDSMFFRTVELLGISYQDDTLSINDIINKIVDKFIVEPYEDTINHVKEINMDDLKSDDTDREKIMDFIEKKLGIEVDKSLYGGDK